MTHRRRLAKPLTLTGLVGSNPTPGAPVNLPPMLITHPPAVKTGRSSSPVRTSDQLRQALTQRRSSVRITPGPHRFHLGMRVSFVSTPIVGEIHRTQDKSWDEHEVDDATLPHAPDDLRTTRPLFRTFLQTAWNGYLR